MELKYKIKSEEEFDVVVLGAGPAGISAAVSAAKEGANVALVERYGYSGGLATGGLVILLVGLTDGKNRIIKGFCEQTINRLKATGFTKDIGNHVLFDAEAMKYLFDSMILENNIKPFYHSYATDVIKKDVTINAVVIQGKSGTRILKAKAFIDATGDADLAEFSSIPYYKEPISSIMPTTLGFRAGGINFEKAKNFLNTNYDFYKTVLKNLNINTDIGGWIQTLNPNEAWFNISTVENIDITNSDDLTKAEIKARKQIQDIIKAFKSSFPGFENAYLIDTASQIGGRESRRVQGVHYFKKEDAKKRFDDCIAKAPDYTNGGNGSIDVPFTCLISPRLNNVIFAGRCISVEHNLLDIFREIPCCMATGQAAGIAAAMLKNTSNVYELDIKNIQKKLKKQGAYLPDSEDSSLSLMLNSHPQ